MGHHVTGLEIDAAKLDSLLRGRAPFHEAGLDDLISSGLSSGHLFFTRDMAEAMYRSDIVFICVGTPSGPDGHPDMSAIASVARALAANLHYPHILVTKSTVPIGTGRWLATVLEDAVPAGSAPDLFRIVSNPEFLREGNAVQDFLHPDRVVLGGDDAVALATVADAYRPVLERDFPEAAHQSQPVPIVFTDITTAETIKYASNSFLATKVSFVNEIARICEHVGADVTEVSAAMGLDPRIGAQFLDAGMGWGGSCFGKDVRALVATARRYGYRPRILEAALAVNHDQRALVVEELLHHLKLLAGARLAVLGLAFKPGTDDLRDSPAVEICERLVENGSVVTAYDPMVPDTAGPAQVRRAPGPLEAAQGADAILIATEWPQFLSLDLQRLRERMRGRLFVDGRNVFDPARVLEAGFEYVGVGRRSPSPGVLLAV
jgi:nucleotide sugar dehydrogenase